MNISPAASSFRPLNADFNLDKPQLPNKETPKSNIQQPLEDIDVDPSLVEEPTVSMSAVKEYLEAIAIADSAKSSVSDIGYIVTGAALATVAFLALSNLSLVKERTQLKDSLFACESNAADPNSINTLDWTALRPSPSGQFYGTATKIINDFFEYSPNALAPDPSRPQNCRFVPLFIKGNDFGLQKRCIERDPLDFKANTLTQGLTFTASPYISNSNSTTPGYHALTFVCTETLDLAPHHVTFNSKCTGTLQSYVPSSLNETDPPIHTTSKINNFYLGTESVDAKLIKSGLDGRYKAVEESALGNRLINKEVQESFARPEEMNPNDFTFLREFTSKAAPYGNFFTEKLGSN